MAITSVFTCGAECGYLPSHWTTITGPVTVSAVQKAHGANSIKVAAAGADASALWTTSAQAAWVVRFNLYLDGLPAADALLAEFVGASSDAALAFDHATSKLCLVQYGDWANRVLGPVIATATLTVIDIKVSVVSTKPVMSWQVDGSAQTGYTGPAAIDISTFVIGQEGAWSSGPSLATYTAYFDDILISNTAADYPLGAGQVIGYRPTSDGTHTFAGTNACLGTTASPTGGTAITSALTTAYTAVDDASINGTGDFWNQKAVSATTYAEVNFDDITAIPRAVEALVSISAASTAACTQKAVLYDGATASDIYALGTVGVAHPTLVYKRKHYAAAPSAAWTVALFNALRVRWGYADDATPDIYCDNIVLEVETAVSIAPTLKVRRSAAWTAGAVKVRRSGAWVAPTAVKVRRSGAWTTVT